ncbi:MULTISPECIES: hypothetical protein [unclassified Micromonospora]|uniref:hypothetical protein n=1 Tax=unclassified Micromonospora TaxID=2617518 RepID=UPI001C24EB92|nr:MULTISPECIES: hypothetical protein [unclassified Micromonospora]MBU8859752.1 hypothetical protein [Micromonospora sp. WMMB482]MDM4779268.1 hypothetical protein [Micromonospora sp. b486]
MGIFGSIARGLGSLRPLSDADLEDEREALRQRYVSSDNIGEASNLYNELGSAAPIGDSFSHAA